MLEFIELETSRLRLKGLTPENMDFIFTNYSKEEIQQILGHQSDDDYLQERAKQELGYASYNRRFLLFLLTHKDSGTIIGRCGLHNWNISHSRAEIGYNMHYESFKNKGLMTEAAEKILLYGFYELKIHRIEAIVGIENMFSQKILHKLHFTEEATMKDYFKREDQFEDALLYYKIFNN